MMVYSVGESGMVGVDVLGMTVEYSGSGEAIRANVVVSCDDALSGAFSTNGKAVLSFCPCAEFEVFALDVDFVLGVASMDLRRFLS